MIRFIERLIYPLFFVTVVIGLAYWYWTTTPTYALTQIVAAIKNKDADNFEKYVDVECIAYRAIDDVIHGPARESGMLSQFDNMMGVGIIGLFKPEIAEIAKTQVLKYIRSGAISSNMKDFNKTSPLAIGVTSPSTITSNSNIALNTEQKSIKQTNPITNSVSAFDNHHSDNSLISKYGKKIKIQKQLKAYGLSKEGFKGIEYIKTEGSIALIGFKFHSPKLNRDLLIEIKMEDAGGYWRVTELSNLNAIINTYLETRDKIEED